MKSRIVQVILLLVLFAAGVAFFSSGNSTPVEDSSYTPLSP